MLCCCRRMWDRWVMMGGIGVTVGLIGFLLYTFIGIFGAVKYHTVRSVSFNHQQGRLPLAVRDGWLSAFSVHQLKCFVHCWGSPSPAVSEISMRYFLQCLVLQLSSI